MPSKALQPTAAAAVPLESTRNVRQPRAALSGCNRMLGGASPPTLLGRCRTNDYRPAAGGRERHATACDRLVDQARDFRTSDCGRALQVNPARLVSRALQQFRSIRQFLT